MEENEEQYCSEIYQEIYQKHDKLFRKILENKEEAAKLINKILKSKKTVTANDIEKYYTVIYTGNRKWNAKGNTKDDKEVVERYDRIDLARYNLIDINDLKEKELLEEKSFLSKAMLIEKTKDSDKLVECLEKIIEEMNEDRQTYENGQRKLLGTVIDLILSRKIGQETANRMIEKLK